MMAYFYLLILSIGSLSQLSLGLPHQGLLEKTAPASAPAATKNDSISSSSSASSSLFPRQQEDEDDDDDEVGSPQQIAGGIGNILLGAAGLNLNQVLKGALSFAGKDVQQSVLSKLILATKPPKTTTTTTTTETTTTEETTTEEVTTTEPPEVTTTEPPEETTVEETQEPAEVTEASRRSTPEIKIIYIVDSAKASAAGAASGGGKEKEKEKAKEPATEVTKVQEITTLSTRDLVAQLEQTIAKLHGEVVENEDEDDEDTI